MPSPYPTHAGAGNSPAPHSSGRCGARAANKVAHHETAQGVRLALMRGPSAHRPRPRDPCSLSSAGIRCGRSRAALWGKFAADAGNSAASLERLALAASNDFGRRQVKGIQRYPEIVLMARLRGVHCGTFGSPPWSLP